MITKRQRKKLLTVGLSLVIAGVVSVGQRYGYIEKAKEQAVNIAEQSQPGLYKVTKTEDGDTITVDMNGKYERVRLIGVDTPETKDPRTTVQCFGKAASDFTKQIIGDDPVRLESDPTNTNRDRYDRLLRYVYLPDGRLLNSEIIKQGYGFAYILFPFQKMEEFKKYEAEAREQGKGLWGQCQINQKGDKKTTNPAIN